MRSLGVLEASASLDDAIKNFAQAPANFDRESARNEFVELYAVAGSDGASIVLDRCMRIMRDPSESLEGKIVVIRILDLLMVDQGERLARALVAQLRFFTSIAKRSKERERKKRRPTGMFSPRVSDDEVAQFVAAVGELLDKWGRRFEEAPMSSELKAIANARAELVEDRVRLPSPESYRYLGGFGGGLGGAPLGLAGGGSEGSAGLDEGTLSRLADDFQSSLQRLGPEATETAEAHSRFEAELARWRRAAQEAAERDDFAGYERYSEVAIRFAELGNRLETSAANSAAASAASTPATSPAPPAERGPWPAAEEASGGGRRKRHHSRPPKDSGGGVGGFAMGAEAGGFNPGPLPEALGGFNPGLPPEAASSFNPGPEVGGFPFFPQPPPPLPPPQQEDAFGAPAGPVGGSFGGSFGCGAGFGQEAGGPPPMGPPLEPAGGFGPPVGSFGPPPGSCIGGPPAPAFGDGLMRGPTGTMEEPVPEIPPPAPAPPPPFEQRGPEGPSEREATLMRMNAQLMSQVQALQAQNRTLQAQLELRASEASATTAPPEQLRSAMRRLRDLEPLQAELADSRATATSMRELSEQLQGELDRCRRELRQVQQRVAEAEERLVEREDVITETRQRLFDAKQRSAQLEDEIKNQSESQKHLQGRLQTARADREVSESELRHLRHAMASVGGLPSQPEQRRGNQSYSRDPGASAPQGARPTQSPPLSVNQFDELAGSSMSAAGGMAGVGGGGTPLQQLARSRVGSKLGDQPEPASSSEQIPWIPRSPLEVWQRTPRIARPPGAIVSQSPPASRACLERVNANFRELLVADRGALFEDQGIVMNMSIVVVSAPAAGGRPCIDFEACVANGSGRALHDVQLRPSEPSARSRACELRIEAEPLRPGALASQARPQQRRFRGRLEVFGPFETGPQVDLAYLLPDNLSLRARLRLPLAITRFMHPGKLEAARAAELWADPELAHSEVAVVCTVRRRLLGAGAPYSVWKCMELGGVFRCFPGIDENSRGAVLASAYPQRQGQWSEVLVRGELGAPGAAHGESDACRVAVRSGSHEVNKALAQVFLDVLCDAPESAAAA